METLCSSTHVDSLPDGQREKYEGYYFDYQPARNLNSGASEGSRLNELRSMRSRVWYCLNTSLSRAAGAEYLRRRPHCAVHTGGNSRSSETEGCWQGDTFGESRSLESTRIWFLVTRRHFAVPDLLVEGLWGASLAQHQASRLEASLFCSNRTCLRIHNRSAN